MSAEKCLAVAMLFFWVTVGGMAVGWSINCIGILLKERAARRPLTLRFPIHRREVRL